MAAAFAKYWVLINFTVYAGLMTLGVYAVHWCNTSHGWSVLIAGIMVILSILEFAIISVWMESQ